MIEIKRRSRYMPLCKDVIAVAVEGTHGDWAAYVGAVAGLSHEREWKRVAESGCKLKREVAEVLFPDFKGLEWRY